MWVYTLLSVIIVSLISLVGVLTLGINQKRIASFLLSLVSFSVGALLGDVFIHLLPEVVEEAGFTPQISFYVLLGIVSTFLLEKLIHWQHAQPTKKLKEFHPASVVTLFGDGVHNFIDGVIIAVSYLVDVKIGLATTIAVVLHEIPQEIGNFGVLLHWGFTRRRALWFNFLSALTAILGAVLALFVGSRVENFIVPLAAYTAGNFIYIAGSDLIPELHREVSPRRSFLQLITMIAGIIVMMLLLLLE